MSDNSRLRRFYLRSPLALLLFAVLPGLLVASRIFPLRLPFRFTTELILANFICLLLLVSMRCWGYLSGLRGVTRYGAGWGRPAVANDLARPVGAVRADLEGAGYRFSGDGAYGEKADLGYSGTILVYGGLFLLLATGIWDNLSQFSGTFLQGLGKAAPLASRDTYFPSVAGPFASIGGLPKLEVARMNFMDKNNSKGSVDIVLLSKNNKPVGAATIAVGGDSYLYRGYDLFLGRLLVDAGLIIKPRGDNGGAVLFKDAVKLSPLWKKEGAYSFYGTFTNRSNLDGELYYSPEKNLFKVKLARDGKAVLETEYPYQAVLHQVAGDYDLSFVGVGRWGEIHVVHHRRMSLIWAGAIVAILGLAMRMLFRPQRVWLEPEGDGCRVRTVGARTRMLVLGGV